MPPQLALALAAALGIGWYLFSNKQPEDTGPGAPFVLWSLLPASVPSGQPVTVKIIQMHGADQVKIWATQSDDPNKTPGVDGGWRLWEIVSGPGQWNIPTPVYDKSAYEHVFLQLFNKGQNVGAGQMESAPPGGYHPALHATAQLMGWKA